MTIEHETSPLLPESLDQVFQGEVRGSGSRDGLPEVVNFRICELLGEGGMGMVYKAIQEYPERVVALKVMRPTIWQAKAAARFNREIQILARLQHPAIARLYTAGTMIGPGGASPFLAMELVSGVPVTSFVRGKPPAQRLRVAIEICDAVAYAHGEGIIHRDLKPANVLVDEAGRAKILDFGLGALLTQRYDTPDLTEMGQFLGTPDYMSPEQAKGSRLDERADVYSLGVLLYEVLAGRRPVDLSGHSMLEASRMIQEEDAPALRSVCPWVNRDVEMIVGKAMAKEPHRRYASAAALADDLRRFMDNRPIAARRSTAAYRASRLLRRHRYLALSTSLIVVSLAAGMGIALHEAKSARVHERLAQIQLAEAQVAQADMCLTAGNVTRARNLYVSARDIFVQSHASPLPAALGLWELDAHTAFPLRTLDIRRAPKCVALSRDGSLLSVLTSEGSLVVEDATAGTLLWQAHVDAESERVAFSRDSTQVAVLSTTAFTVLQTKTGEVLRRESLSLSPGLLAVGRDEFCAFTTDGQLVVVPTNGRFPVVHLEHEQLGPIAGFDELDRLWTIANDGTVYHASLPAWKLERTGHFPRSAGDNLAFGENGDWVVKDASSKIEFWTPTGSQVVATLAGPLHVPGFGSPPNAVFRFDRSSGLVELVKQSGEIAVRIPSKAPKRITAGGDLIFVEDSSLSSTLWQDRSARCMRNIELPSPPSGLAAISSDGRIAAIPAGSQIELVDTTSGRGIATINADEPFVDVSLDRTGSSLVACTADHHTQFWNMTGGRFTLLAGKASNAKRVAMAPSGKMAISCSGDERPAFWVKSGDGNWASHLLNVSAANFAKFSDTKELMLIAGPQDVEVWTTSDQPQRLSHIHPTGSTLHGAAFVADTTLVVTLDAFGILSRWSARSGEYLGPMTLPPGRITSVGSSGDLVFCLEARNLCVYTADGRLVRQIPISIGGALEAGGGKVLTVRQGTGAQVMDFSKLN